jgi:hypothetical protein
VGKGGQGVEKCWHGAYAAFAHAVRPCQIAAADGVGKGGTPIVRKRNASAAFTPNAFRTAASTLIFGG